VGRTPWHGMSSRAVLADGGDQRSMSSLMRSGGRSGPRARRASIQHVSLSRSCSIGQRNWLWPMCGSPPCPVRCQLSSAATQLSNGTSMIRQNDSQLTDEHVSAFMLACPARRECPGRSLVAPVERVLCAALAARPTCGLAAARHPWPHWDQGFRAGPDTPRGGMCACTYRKARPGRAAHRAFALTWQDVPGCGFTDKGEPRAQ
jgi:hypothetical protein